MGGVDFVGDSHGGDAAVGLDEFCFFGGAGEGFLDAGFGEFSREVGGCLLEGTAVGGAVR